MHTKVVRDDPDRRPQAICTGCNRVPVDISEFAPEFTGEDMSPDDYVWREEGTLNTSNGHFLCTSCYIEAGQPSSRYGWTAP